MNSIKINQNMPVEENKSDISHYSNANETLYYEVYEDSFEMQKMEQENNKIEGYSVYHRKKTKNAKDKTNYSSKESGEVKNENIDYRNNPKLKANNKIINVNVNINKPTIHVRTSSCLRTQKSVYQICNDNILNENIHNNNSDDNTNNNKDVNSPSSYEDSSEEEKNSGENPQKLFNSSPVKVNRNKNFQNPTFKSPYYSNSNSNSNNGEQKRDYTFNSLSISSSLKISLVHFEDISDEDINLNFLKTKLRTINVKSKGIQNQNNKHFKTLIELQNFYIEKSPIWIIKFSTDGKYLATGCKKGIVKIFEVMNYEYDDFKLTYSKNEIFSYLFFLNEKPKRILNEHTSDVIDLAWSSHNPSYLLTASLDHYVILWDVNNENSLLHKYQHGDMVTSVSFSPFVQNIFITGCLDRFVRIWSFNPDTKPEYFNIKEKITAISFFPSGDAVAIGAHNGKIIIYDIEPKISYNCSFSCRNRVGKNSLGKKVTNIEFVNKSSALITTADSRIRYVSMPDGKMIHKYKGHLNEQSMIRAHNDMLYDMVISGSEDGYCFIWNRKNKENKKKKNYSYEYFKPFSKDVVECSVFVSENCMAGYLKKFFKLTTNIFIVSIIVNATDKGRLQILLNVEENTK